jgi:hypothetical protein
MVNEVSKNHPALENTGLIEEDLKISMRRAGRADTIDCQLPNANPFLKSNHNLLLTRISVVLNIITSILYNR